MNVPFDSGLPPVVPIRISGPSAEKELDALLSTAATYLTLPWEDAIEMGYDPTHAPEVRVATAPGFVMAPLIEVKKVQLLGVTLENVKVLVKDVDAGGVDVLLGWSVLEYFKFAFDPKTKQLQLEKA